MSALHYHRTNPALDVFNKAAADRDLLAKPIEVATCEPVTGFQNYSEETDISHFISQQEGT